MNINDFVKNNTAVNLYSNGRLGSTTASRNSVAQVGLEKADKRIQALVDTNTTQLSGVGKLKSAVATLQGGAQSLSRLPGTTNSADTKTALVNFVKVFNDAANAAKAGGSGTSPDTATAQAANGVSRSLQRAVTNDASTTEALKQVGVSLSSEGKLVIDTAKFDAVQSSNAGQVKSNLAKIGLQLDKAARQELAASGTLGSRLASLNQNASVLKSQQTALQALGGSTGSASGSRFGNLGYGLSAYQNS
jgi:hypothetical protein